MLREPRSRLQLRLKTRPAGGGPNPAFRRLTTGQLPSLGAPGCHLVRPAPTGEQDQVLVKLEPDPVVAVDAG